MPLVISWIFKCKRLSFINWRQESVRPLPKNGAVREKLLRSLEELLEPSRASAIHSPARPRKTTHRPQSPRHSALFGPAMTEIITSLIDLFLNTCFNI